MKTDAQNLCRNYDDAGGEEMQELEKTDKPRKLCAAS